MAELRAVCEKLANDLQLTVQGLDKTIFLLAISGVESSFGKNLGPRFEMAYAAPNGFYYKGNTKLQELYKKFGPDAASSFGPWQILYICAVELGFTGEPNELKDPNISGPFVVKKFNQISRNGANSVERLLDAWNTGNWKKGPVPLEYIRQFLDYYNKVHRGEIA